jgi:hypothetical protein
MSFAQTKAPTFRALYVEDQRDRGVALADDGVSLLPKEQADKLPSYDWQTEVPKHDEARREEARTLLEKPGLSGEEYFYAAYLFQHGQDANDYLFAHILAMQAVALGYTRAKWISAATLDRYLEQIGQKQVFGTQYVGENLAYYLEHQHDSDVIEKFKALSNQQTLEPYAPQTCSVHDTDRVLRATAHNPATTHRGCKSWKVEARGSADVEGLQALTALGRFYL